MDAVFLWVRNIVVFSLAAALLEELLPDSDFKKYIRVTAGMVFILVVFSPLLKLFGAGDFLKEQLWQESVNSISENGGLQSFDGEAAQSRADTWILEEYKRNLEDQIRVLAENEGCAPQEIRLSVDEDPASEDFGSIRHITIVAADRKKEVPGDEAEPENTADPVRAVEPVVIGKNPDGRSGGAQEAGASSDAGWEALKRLLAENYGIPVSAVTITVEGDDDE